MGRVYDHDWQEARTSQGLLGSVRSFLKTVRLSVPLLWQVAPWLALGTIFLTLVNSVLPATKLLLTKRIVDGLNGVGRGQTEWVSLLWVVGALGILDLVSSGAGQLQDLLNLRQTQKVEHHLQSRVMQRIGEAPLTDFVRPRFHDRLQHIRTGIGFHSVRWLEQMVNLARQVAGLAGVLAVLAQIHPAIPLAVCASILPTVWTQTRFGRLRFLQMRFMTPLVRRVNYLADLVVGQHCAAEIRLFGAAGFLRDKWDRLFREDAEAAYLLRRQGAAKSVTADFAAIAIATGTLLLLFLRGTSLQLSPGDYIIVLQALQSVRGQGGSLAVSVAQINEDALFLADLFDFLSEGEIAAVHTPRQAFPAVMREGIEARSLSFSYPDAPKLALKNVSFRIRPGERVAIVGENGSGKSTLVKCLLGLYQPSEGSLYFDGIAVEQISPESLYASVTAIFQDFSVYHLSVRENVAIGDPSRINDQRGIEEALERSDAMKFVRELPHGIDTELGSPFAGVDLSKGQWQKLAMARAFIKESQIIIMDEPTASLDPQTEAHLFRQFAELAAAKTALLVSHRLGMCHTVDRILVMKDGDLVEQGTHDELMALDGEYARMYSLQASWYESPERARLENRKDDRCYAS